jgi:hypothetical protein
MGEEGPMSSGDGRVHSVGTSGILQKGVGVVVSQRFTLLAQMMGSSALLTALHGGHSTPITPRSYGMEQICDKWGTLKHSKYFS